MMMIIFLMNNFYIIKNKDEPNILKYVLMIYGVI